MNKKIFATALLAVAALTSFSASAAISLQTSNGNSNAGYAQGGNAMAAAGGSSVRANDILVAMSADDDLQVKGASDNKGFVTVRLPKGVNFDGAPGFSVSSLTPSVGLTLKDSAGDPVTKEPGVALSDTDNDGGMDRAVIEVSRANVAQQTLTISINLTVGADVVAGVKQASVTYNGGVYTADVVQVVKNFSDFYTTSLALVGNLDQTAQLTTPTISTRVAVVTIPKGTAAGTKLTFTPEAGVHFLNGGGEGSDPNFDGTSTITATILTPNSAAFPSGPLSGSLTINANTLGTKTVSISFVITGTTTTTLPDDMQVKLAISQVALKATTTTGERGLAVSGAVTGSWPLVKVAANGSAAAVKGTVTQIVTGSSVVKVLPPITITENFAGDTFTKGDTGTITLTPSAGLVFDIKTASATVSTGFRNATPTVSATTGALSFTLFNDNTSKTLTITGLRATVKKGTDAGTLTITVTGNRTAAPKGDVLEVASAVNLGTVSAGLPAKYKNIMTGPGGPANSTSIEIKETTYGAITRASASVSTPSYISFTPSSNAKISAVSFSFSGYAAGATPTLAVTSVCAVDAVGSLVWVCPVEGESTAVTPGTSTVTAKISWSASADAEVGSDVLITLGGNSGVSGEVKAGTVGQTTKAEISGAIPDIKPGSLSATKLATVKVTELFTGAVTNTTTANFRLLAPAGVSFQDATGIATLSSSASGAVISSTFRPNDTVMYTKTGATATVTFTAKVVVASDVSGLLAFDLVDGNLDGKNLSGISPATLNLGYADGTLEALSAGKAASVNAGFKVANTVEGGLADYTVASGDKTIATAEISGSTVTVTGVAAGIATITVTDALGATASYKVTVAAGAAEPAQGKATKASDGSESAATFTGGATIDGGDSYTDAVTTTDDVVINATINVDPEDVGEAGGIHALVLAPGGLLLMLDSDGSWVPWDGKLTTIATYLEVEELEATYSVPLYNGTIATAGKWRFAVIYSTDAGKLVYTTKAAVITVSE